MDASNNSVPEIPATTMLDLNEDSQEVIQSKSGSLESVDAYEGSLSLNLN